MSFIWPALLIFLICLPLFALLYLALLRRRQSSVSAIGGFGRTSRQAGKIRRHVPALLFFIGLGVLIFALARPQMVVALPRLEGTVILAFDVSGSMAAQDLEPNRMEAAKTAAIEFVSSQPSTVQIGVVAFSEGGFSILPPTNDSPEIIAAIQRLQPERGTSIGDGILASLNAIIGGNGKELETGAEPSAEENPISPSLPEETYPSAVIVLLTDGENTAPPDPIAAAQAASDLGVRIYPIGIGSAAGTTLEVDGFFVHTRLDEAVLQQIAQISSGVYFNAANVADFQEIYAAISPQLQVKAEKTEVTSIFAGAGLLFLLVGGAFSLIWFSRIP